MIAPVFPKKIPLKYKIIITTVISILLYNQLNAQVTNIFKSIVF
jgi:hypothetical protein